MKNRLTLFLSILSILVLPANASNTVYSEHSWNDSNSTSSLQSPKNPILRRYDANQVSFKNFVSTLCRQAGLHVIFDRSVLDMMVSASYTDKTITEILADVCQKQGLRCRNLADNVVLIESSDAQSAVYPAHYEEQLPQPSLAVPTQVISSPKTKYKYGLIPPPPPIVPSFSGIPPPPPPILP